MTDIRSAAESLRNTARLHAVVDGSPSANLTHEEELWLLGLPPLSRYLDFVEHTAMGVTGDRATLAEEWRAANDHYQELERREAGAANRGTHSELDPILAPLVAEVRSDARFRKTFDTLPTSFCSVELDTLIVSQKHVTSTFVDRLMTRIGRNPDAQTLFRFCMPLKAQPPAVQAFRVGPHRYAFRCRAADLRYHETTVLRPEQIPEYHSFGDVAGVLGVVVGFGCNFLYAVRVGNRLLLQNGYHRACALRALGLTHAPCIVQTATRADEVHTAMTGLMANEAEFYFESARPPLLKDFFDPLIRKKLPVRTRMHVVEVSFEVRDLAECPVSDP